MKANRFNGLIIGMVFFTYLWSVPQIIQGEMKDFHKTKASSQDQSETIKIQYEEIKEKEPEYEIDIKIPSIKGMKDDVFQVKFNYGMKAKAKKKIDEFKKEAIQFAREQEQKGQPLRPFQLHIQPVVKKKGEFISVLNESFIYKGGANGIQKVQTLNILNDEQAKKLAFSDIFREESKYKYVINDFIKQAIEERRNKGEVFFEGEEGFQSVTENQSFYFEDRQLVVVFDEYEIAPGAMGTPSFQISLEKIKDLIKPEIYKAVLDS
ncbi:protein of unknown function [Salinibacillus kushneri]|uniref:DUF3298 domain-containing protein n=1 Tax=Salinibacillus kushneri TaxID=237682 RepID=A0A1I0FBJ2_9BACI|nr:DUF3298 and DUF4163 domain-containing protein [Salinibacillus kushneri]SET55482.1 protein of unknown function [Salinibacillus kushneri]